MSEESRSPLARVQARAYTEQRRRAFQGVEDRNLLARLEEFFTTKEQQDVYFHEDRCPCCRSEELLSASWDDREGGRTRVREVICDDCAEERVEVYYRDTRCGFLLKSGEAEGYFDDEDDLEGDGPDEAEEDDTDDEDDAVDADPTGASANGAGEECMARTTTPTTERRES